MALRDKLYILMMIMINLTILPVNKVTLWLIFRYNPIYAGKVQQWVIQRPKCKYLNKIYGHNHFYISTSGITFLTDSKYEEILNSCVYIFHVVRLNLKKIFFHEGFLIMIMGIWQVNSNSWCGDENDWLWGRFLYTI